MGTRYHITIECETCGFIDDAYYAPTCDITEWVCPNCHTVVDLEELTGITAEQASNREEICKECEKVKTEHERKE